MRDIDNQRRGLLLTAAAAGATLVIPRLILGATDNSNKTTYGGDLTAVRAAIEKAAARGHQAPAGLDRAALHRRGEPQHARRVVK
jgi:hypothetical protein